MKKILLLLLIFNLVYCAWLYSLRGHDTQFNYFYNISYALNFGVSAIACLTSAFACHKHRWIHLSLGLGSVCFGFAQLSWFIYNSYLHTDVPFPGVPDYFFIGFYIFVALGGILTMYQAIDIKFHLSQILEIAAVTGVLFLIINSFISSTTPQIDLPLTTQLLNYIYPFFDSLLVVLTLTAIRSKLGALQPLLLYFMFAFILLAFADTLFTYQSSLEIYWNGNIVDAIFALGSFFFAMGILSLPTLLHAHDSGFKLTES